ncbi:MAG: response regulator, partial [Sulfurimonas sp.]
NNLIVDSNMMNTEALKGNLDAQIDASKYQGDFGKISVGINGFVEQVRNYRQGNDEQNWVKDGTSKLNEIINQSTGMRNLATNAMNLIARYSESGVGGLYIVDSSNEKANLYASYAYTERSALSNEFAFGHGIIGQVALEKKAILLKNIKNNDLVIASGTTESAPQNIYAYPLVYQDELVGVIEVGSYEPFSALHLQYFNETIVPLAASLNTMKSKEETQSLYLQANSFAEELRGKNLELLEQQQTLERQTQELEISQQETLEQNKEMEIQNNILIQSRIDLDKRTNDLEESNRYKSQFLANMSHELRTPLNSVMLLSKTLSKNKKENLDNDQVKQLTVIHQAGDELLHLINDILDLSKIEARLMTLSVGEIPVSTLLDSVYDMFKPLADEKNIYLSIAVDENTPKSIVSDKEKIRQIIKNFVSNAIKFTPENGSIVIRAQRDLENSALPIRLSVVDNGIGIASEKHKLVFEAFKQADGGTSRKYGGTGLGLSISKELGNLLGGAVSLISELNKGSTFALNLPEKMDTRSINPDLIETVSYSEEHTERLAKILIETAHDDRDGLALLEESVLIVEDDNVYSNILLQKVNELGYKGLIAATGFEAISMANKFQPHAILLDIHLPDFDGWEVLRLLKNDTNTRHIPVKIISADEPNLLAKRMGAVNFIQKPNNEEGISEIIQSIMKLSKNKHKTILVVEDDPVQRDHIVSVLEGDNIEIVAVEDVRSALNHDMSKHFDCAIIDLNLPGESGFSLLNVLRKKMCPVPIIVFTARDLTHDEIMLLREYEATVILKTANSYERLLEEVSIFIHRGKEGFSVESQKLFSAGKDSKLNGKNILVVDDDFRNIFALSSVLEQEGLNIFTAVNGVDGIDILEKNPAIDLVLMDMMMPVMDGYEAMKRIRNNPIWSNLPIIALTAKAQREDHDLCIKAGANDYLSKPLDHEKLLLLIKLWLNNSSKKSV